MLITNRNTARSSAVEEVEGINGVSITQRDISAGLTDSAHDLSYYSMTKDGDVRLNQYKPPGTTFYKYA